MNIHIIGIKGWGTSALAQLLATRGDRVCGSDVSDHVPSEHGLEVAHITLEPFSADDITQDIDRVVYSTAIPSDHPERVRARELGIEQISYPEAVAELFNVRYGVSLCGTHGKTTCTALLSFICVRLGIDASAIIGSVVPQLGSNALVQSGNFFILETDEYQNKLQYYHPRAVLVTSIEWDHPDFFPTEESYRDAFRAFLSGASIEHLIACSDDEGVRACLPVRQACLPKRSSVRTYGWNEGAHYRATDYRIEGERTVFTVWREGILIGDCALRLFGKHNATNALGVIALSEALGIAPLDRVLEIIEAFEGTLRRCEYKGIVGPIEVYGDYAHHPTEVRATLGALRERMIDKRIWCVFAPHTYSRTKALLSDFAHSFDLVDHVLVMDIYGAREERGAIHSRDLTDAINAHCSKAEYSGTINETLALLKRDAHNIDIVVFMGASEDLWKAVNQFVGIRE